MACESDLTDIIQRLDQLEVSSLETQNNSSLHGTSMVDCLDEWENRYQRKYNLIIFDINKNATITGEEEKNNDKSTVVSFFNSISPNVILPTNIKVTRIGFPSQAATKPRPLKVAFLDTQLPKVIREDYFKLKSIKQIPQIIQSFLPTPDRTKLQQQEYQAREEIIKREGVESGTRFSNKVSS